MWIILDVSQLRLITANMSCAFLLEIRGIQERETQPRGRNISIQSNCGIHQSVKMRSSQQRHRCMCTRCSLSLSLARALQNPGTDVASYCALPAESRSTSLSDWVTECRASFIGVHFRPEKPILLRDTQRTICQRTYPFIYVLSFRRRVCQVRGKIQILSAHIFHPAGERIRITNNNAIKLHSQQRFIHLCVKNLFLKADLPCRCLSDHYAKSRSCRLLPVFAILMR